MYYRGVIDLNQPRWWFCNAFRGFSCVLCGRPFDRLSARALLTIIRVFGRPAACPIVRGSPVLRLSLSVCMYLCLLACPLSVCLCVCASIRPSIGASVLPSVRVCACQLVFPVCPFRPPVGIVALAPLLICAPDCMPIGNCNCATRSARSVDGRHRQPDRQRQAHRHTDRQAETGRQTDIQSARRTARKSQQSLA